MTAHPAPHPHPGAPQPAGFPQGVAIASPWLRLGSYLLEGVLMVVTLYIGWIIWALTTGPTGQTPAKKLLGLRVIRIDTARPAGLATMFWMRAIVGGFVAGLAIAFTLGVLAFMPLWDRYNQNMWDKISNCYVVTDPYDGWNTATGAPAPLPPPPQAPY